MVDQPPHSDYDNLMSLFTSNDTYFIAKSMLLLLMTFVVKVRQQRLWIKNPPYRTGTVPVPYLIKCRWNAFPTQLDFSPGRFPCLFLLRTNDERAANNSVISFLFFSLS
jgi:hypothetical protein